MCDFDLCELYNMIFGGLVIGVIASFLFVWITRVLAVCRFRKRYKHLSSPSNTEYDWVAYSMSKENGRMKSDIPNGSSLNVSLSQDRIYLKLKQSDSRKWKGELRVETFDYGLVTYKYEDDHEYGKRECIIGNYKENDKVFDYIYLIPTNNKIHYIQNDNDQRGIVEYNYGDEIFIRQRPK